MCLLFETIKVENGKIFNIEYHQNRVNDTFSSLFKQFRPHNLLAASENADIPETGIYRMRITYDENNLMVELFPYVRRKITELVMIEAAGLQYPHKYDDRSVFGRWTSELAINCEPVFIVNGRVTDTSFSNLAFYDETGWYTPDTYLLKGTKREFYIKNGLLRECVISPMDIKKYSRVSLINAMCDIGDIVLDTKSVTLL